MPGMQARRCFISSSYSCQTFLGRNYSALPQLKATTFNFPWADSKSLAVQTSSAVNLNGPSRSRFDWRKRAISRLPPEKKPPRHTKRVRPRVELTYDGRYYDASQSYSDRFLPLIAAEQAKQDEELQRRLSTWTLAKLQKEGYCLTRMSAFWLKVNKYGRPVAAFSLGPGVILPAHQLENGTQVLISRIDPLQEKPLRGSISSQTASLLKISFRDQDLRNLSDLNGTWRLDLANSNINYDRMRFAISCLKNDPEKLERNSPKGNEYPLLGTHLRDILLRTFQPTIHHPHTELQLPDDPSYPSHDGLDHIPSKSLSSSGAFSDDVRIWSWAQRYLRRNPLVMPGDPIVEGMNSSQVRAMALMISQRLSLVQGPPGTGKTKTIIETVKLLKCHFEVPQPILLCTYTNAAVDNLVEGLAAVGLKPLRVAAGGRVKPQLQEYTLEDKRSIHPKKPELDRLEKQEQDLEGEIKNLQQKRELVDDSSLEKRLQNLDNQMTHKKNRLRWLRGRIYALDQEILRDVLSQADVLCTTCLSSAGHAFSVIDFPVVFLDEASMSTEPASLIPLMKGSSHVALIGDHKQLPPVIVSDEGKRMGLGISLFERLTEEGDTPSIMLDTQYRMHPEISRFPASEFYDHALRDGTVDSIGNIHDRLRPPVSSHLSDLSSESPSVIFIDHAGSESMEDHSRVNPDEALIVISIIEDLLLNNLELQGTDIGIISPYAAQISLLYRELKITNQARFREVLGPFRAMQLKDIEIKTVDGFEGRQKEVIIFSTVRNNQGGYIGFLADRRRLNVGLTRAKRGLFVVGSLDTLKSGKMGGYQDEY
ncbi:P-loop containing nucleoside triphosphate hydrolase protein, partial [Pluteus cervinus]